MLFSRWPRLAPSHQVAIVFESIRIVLALTLMAIASLGVLYRLS
jgi:hypothetical protein